MGVMPKEQAATAAELAAAALSIRADKVREAVGRWAPPKVKSPDTGELVTGPARGASVLIVAKTDDEAEQLARALRDAPAEFATVATHGTPAGRGFDLVVYLPGWRGAKLSHPAADQWKDAIVRTRFRDLRVKWELYL